MAQNPFDQFGYAPGVSDVPALKEEQAQSTLRNQAISAGAQQQSTAIQGAKAPGEIARTAQDVRFTPLEKATQQQQQYKKEPAVNKYEEAIPVYAYVVETAMRPDTAVKAGMLFQAAAKIIDPTSVTMTGEVELQAANARRAGIENELASRYKEYIDGTGSLTPEGKRAIINELTVRMKGYNRSYQAVRKDYEQKANRFGLNPVDVIGSHAGAPHKKITEDYNAFQRANGVKIEGDSDAGSAVQGAGGAEPVGFRFTPEQERQIEQYVKSPNFTPQGYAQIVTEAMQERGANIPQEVAFEQAFQLGQDFANNPQARQEFKFGPGSYEISDELTRRQLDAQIAQQNEAVRGGMPDISVPGLVQRAGLGGTMGLSDEIAYLTALASGGNPQVAAAAERRRLELMREQQGVLGYIAEGVGGIVPASGFIRGAQALRAGGAAPILGETAFGAAYGGAEAQEGQRGRGALLGAVTAPAAYGAGVAAGRGLGFIAGGINPAYIPGVRRLQAQGVEPTTGQILREYGRTPNPRGINGDIGGAPGVRGSIARRIAGFEDRLAGLPITGGTIGARRSEAEIASNLAAGRIAVEPLGAQADITATGRDMVTQMEDPIDAAYSTIRGMRIGFDRPFTRNMRRVRNQISRLPEYERNRLTSILDDVVLQRFGQNNVVNGNQLKDINRVFATERQNIMRNPQGNVIDSERAARVLDLMEDSLFGAARRQDPQNFRLWRDASEAFKRSKIVEGAVEGSMARPGMPGVFPQSGLATQVRMAGRKYGQTPIGELSRDITTVLPSQQRDSGTAGQWFTGAMLGGGGIGLATGGAATGGAGLLAVPTIMGGLSLPATRTGQRMINPLLQGTAPGQQALSRGLTDAAPFIGMGGSGAAVPQTTPQLTPEQEAEEQRKLLEAMNLGQTYIRMPVASNPYAVR